MIIVLGFSRFPRVHAQGTNGPSTTDVSPAANSQNVGLESDCPNPDPADCVPPNDGPQIADDALSPSGESGTPFADANSSETGQISTYIVRDGDTLSSIAKMFGVTTNTIVWANDIKNGKIAVDDELVILPISGISHTVVKGDTLQSIAKKYGADVGDILSYNGLSTSDTLSIGETIIVPGGDLDTAPPPSSPKSISTGHSNSPTISCSNGDTLLASNYEKLLVNPCKYPSYPGYYANPLANGGRKTQNLHGYNAVDLADPIGTPIHAAASGKVILVKNNSAWNGGYGNYVVISHPNGTQTLYAHMRNANTAVGDEVEQGDVIGFIGVTGETTGPHVHFEVRGARNPF